MGEEATSEADPVEPCACGIADAAPWTGKRLRGSALAGVFGLLMIGAGLVFLYFDNLRLVGAIILAVWMVATFLASAFVWRQGHRGGCLLKRSLWFGVLVLGAPVRLAFELP